MALSVYTDYVMQKLFWIPLLKKICPVYDIYPLKKNIFLKTRTGRKAGGVELLEENVFKI